MFVKFAYEDSFPAKVNKRTQARETLSPCLITFRENQGKMTPALGYGCASLSAWHFCQRLHFSESNKCKQTSLVRVRPLKFQSFVKSNNRWYRRKTQLPMKKMKKENNTRNKPRWASQISLSHPCRPQLCRFYFLKQGSQMQMIFQMAAEADLALKKQEHFAPIRRALTQEHLQSQHVVSEC